MIDMHSKYDNMYKNEILYYLICINDNIITSISYMLSSHCGPHERQGPKYDHILQML